MTRARISYWFHRWLGSMLVGLFLLTSHARAQPSEATAFHADMATKAIASENTTYIGRDGWLFFTPELQHIGKGAFWGARAQTVSRAKKPEQADPLPAILDFDHQLKKAGIELILVPIPAKAFIYPDKITDIPLSDMRLDSHHQAFYQLLADSGVQVLDLTEIFRMHCEKGVWLYCKHDTHWSGAACEIAARSLADIIKQKPWYTHAPRVQLSQEKRTVKIAGDLWRTLQTDKPPREKLPLRFIHAQNGSPLPPDRESPILLLGDSHALIFHAGGDIHASGAGLIDQLAFETGIPIDLLAVRGSGATPARIGLYRRSRANPTYLQNKKLIIWCFSVREFTESTGWQKVPIQPKR